MTIKKIIVFSTSLLLLSVLAAGGRTKFQRRPESTDNADDGICKLRVATRGYPCQEHKVTTDDGYILSLQRIPAGRSVGGNESAKIPVLLQHGILANAMTWIGNSPDESFGFILADNGYDVWLANARGTKYSSGHTSLSTDDPEYWDWTWDELADYDLPAFFQYIHDQTGQKLHYVGHSLGTLMALGAFSYNQEVVDMVRSAALLSPIAYMGQMPSILVRAAADQFIAENVYWSGIAEFSPGGEVVSKFIRDICTTIDCTDMESIVTGPNCCMNSSNSNIFRNQPTAVKNMVHLAQMIRRGTIAMYDYGSHHENRQHYGHSTPPRYYMADIPNDLPILLSYGGQDLLSDVNDVQFLIHKLSHHDADKLVVKFVPDYAHLDFVYGVNANRVVYDPVMDFFKQN